MPKTTKMLGAAELMAALDGVDGKAWLHDNVYPYIVEALAGQDSLPLEVATAFSQAAQHVLRSLDDATAHHLVESIAPFINRWDEYVVAIMPKGPNRDNALRILRQIRATAI